MRQDGLYSAWQSVISIVTKRLFPSVVTTKITVAKSNRSRSWNKNFRERFYLISNLICSSYCISCSKTEGSSMISSIAGSGLPLSVKVLKLDLGLPEECTDTEEIERSLCCVPGLLRAAAGFEGCNERSEISMGDKRTICRKMHTITLFLKETVPPYHCLLIKFCCFPKLSSQSESYHPHVHFIDRLVWLANRYCDFSAAPNENVTF